MSDAELLPCVEVPPHGGREARFAVIWLHGLGADGHDFEPIVPEIDVGEHAVRFVFPHAPSIPVSINMGMVMPAWYDIREMDLRRRHDVDGVRASMRRLEALVDRERGRGVPDERIVLAGFSQGGAVAIWTGLRHERRLCGIVGLSTYLIGEELLDAEQVAHATEAPVFLAHGTHDPMVALERGQASRDALRSRGLDVVWHEYPMQHQVCLEEIRDLSAWLRERFDAAED
jgi:phospholipase/carboxylesterase